MRIDDDKKNECFRKYETVYESFRDHSEFLTTRSRYSFLFNYKVTDYKNWAKGLKKAGYATNPKYANLLITLIEENNLNQYDKYTKATPKGLTKNKTSEVVLSNKKNQVIRLHNNIKYVIAKKGDSYYGIANTFDVHVWQIYKYNDLNKTDVLQAGDVVYLQPKRNRAIEDSHVVKKGETMRTISQIYGVKLRQLYKKNRMIKGTEPNVGDRIMLKKKKDKLED